MEWRLLDQEIIGLQDAIVQTMRKSGFAPVETGRLRRSITPLPVIDTPQGLKAPIAYVDYGIYPDFGTKYQSAQRFTERAQKLEVDKQAAAIGEAAGYDVLNELDLPTNIDLNLNV